MFRAEEVRWLETLSLDCPKCGQPFGAIVHKEAKARPLLYCPNGCKTALLRYAQRAVHNRYELAGGVNGRWVWR